VAAQRRLPLSFTSPTLVPVMWNIGQVQHPALLHATRTQGGKGQGSAGAGSSKPRSNPSPKAAPISQVRVCIHGTHSSIMLTCGGARYQGMSAGGLQGGGRLPNMSTAARSSRPLRQGTQKCIQAHTSDRQTGLGWDGKQVLSRARGLCCSQTCVADPGCPALQAAGPGQRGAWSRGHGCGRVC
jgi:hypothetical protein